MAFNDGNPATDDLPRVVPYQGVLDWDGQPYNGSVDIQFTLYTEDGVTSLWNEE